MPLWKLDLEIIEDLLSKNDKQGALKCLSGKFGVNAVYGVRVIKNWKQKGDLEKEMIEYGFLQVAK